MSLEIYKRSNPDDLKRELCADGYHDLFRSIETCLNDKKLEKRAEDFYQIYDWDLKRGIPFRIKDLRHRDQELELPDASKFGEEEYLIIISYLKKEWNRRASIHEKEDESLFWQGDHLNKLIRDLLFEVNKTFYMEVE